MRSTVVHPWLAPFQRTLYKKINFRSAKLSATRDRQNYELRAEEATEDYDRKDEKNRCSKHKEAAEATRNLFVVRLSNSVIIEHSAIIKVGWLMFKHEAFFEKQRNMREYLVALRVTL